MAASTGKKGGKKFGRLLRSPAHTRYINTGRMLLNKIKRITKHLKKCENDTVAIKALSSLEGRRR
jgi:hypothetical protein